MRKGRRSSYDKWNISVVISDTAIPLSHYRVQMQYVLCSKHGSSKTNTRLHLKNKEHDSSKAKTRLQLKNKNMGQANQKHGYS